MESCVNNSRFLEHSDFHNIFVLVWFGVLCQLSGFDCKLLSS